MTGLHICGFGRVHTSRRRIHTPSWPCLDASSFPPVKDAPGSRIGRNPPRLPYPPRITASDQPQERMLLLRIRLCIARRAGTRLRLLRAQLRAADPRALWAVLFEVNRRPLSLRLMHEPNAVVLLRLRTAIVVLLSLNLAPAPAGGPTAALARPGRRGQPGPGSAGSTAALAPELGAHAPLEYQKPVGGGPGFPASSYCHGSPFFSGAACSLVRPA